MKIEIQHTQTYGVSKWEVHSDKLMGFLSEKFIVINAYVWNKKSLK